MVKNKKMIAAFLLIMAIGVIFTGCAGGDPAEPIEEGAEDSLETPESNESAPGETDDLETTDDLSGQIELPQNFDSVA